MGMKWWHLSYADDTSFRGAVAVRGMDFDAAVVNANRMGINPGGQVVGYEIPDEILAREYPASLRNCLLTEEQVRRDLGGKTWGEFMDEVIKELF